MHTVNDEIEFIQLGYINEYNFFSFEVPKPTNSFFDTFPTKYRIVSIDIYRDYNLELIDRSTYSLLSYLGDLGGLDGILVSIGYVLCLSISNFQTENYLIS